MQAAATATQKGVIPANIPTDQIDATDGQQDWEMVVKDPDHKIKKLKEKLRSQKAKNQDLKREVSFLKGRTYKQPSSDYHRFFPDVKEPNLQNVGLWSGNYVFLVSDVALKSQCPTYKMQSEEGKTLESLIWKKSLPGGAAADYHPAAVAQVGLFINVAGGNLEESEYRSIEDLAASKPQEEFFKIFHDLLLLCHEERIVALECDCDAFITNAIAKDAKFIKTYFNFFSNSLELFQASVTLTHLKVDDDWVSGCLKACQSEDVSTETIMMILECLKELSLQEKPKDKTDAYCWMQKALKRSVSEIISFVLSPEYLCYEKQDVLPKIFTILTDVFPDLDFDEKLTRSLASVDDLKHMGFEGLVIDTHIRFKFLSVEKKSRRIDYLIRNNKFLDLAYGFLAKINYQDKNWESCRKYLATASEHRRDSISNLTLAMECYIKQGQDELIIHTCSYILSELDPHHLHSLYQKAYLLEKVKKNYKGAIEDADKILKILHRLNASTYDLLWYQLKSYKLKKRCYEALGDAESKERVLSSLRLIRKSISRVRKQKEEEGQQRTGDSKENCILS